MKISEEIKEHIEDSEEKIIITPKCKIIQGSELDILALLVELLNIISTKSGKEYLDKILKDFIEGEFEEFKGE